MIRLSKLRLRNFKSFKKAVIPISNGFTAIGGANGSGKSNVLDAIQFVLGATSLKSLRANKLTELINHDSVEKTAEVSMEIEAIKENKKTTYSVSREIDSQGKSVYRLDSHRKTLGEVSSLLRELKIQSKGYNIIAQGDITSLIEMNPIERRSIIDNVAGIREFDEKKMEALKELEKVDTKIKEARIIIKERETYLVQLESERNGAIEFQALSQELKQNKKTVIDFEATEIKKNLLEKDKKLEIFNQKIISAQNEKIELQKQLQLTAQEVEAINNELIALSSKTALGLGRLIEEKKSSQRILIDRIESRRKAIQEKQFSIKSLQQSTESTINELNESQENLKKKEMELKAISNELESIQKRKNDLMQGLTSSDELGETEKKLKQVIHELDEQKKVFYAKQSELKIIEKEIILSKELIDRINSSQSDQEKSFNELLDLSLKAEKILESRKKNILQEIKNLDLNEKQKNGLLLGFNEITDYLNEIISLVKENIKKGKAQLKIEENHLKTSELNKKKELIGKEALLAEEKLKEIENQKQNLEKEINYLKLKFKVTDLKDLDIQLKEKMNLVNNQGKNINELKTRIDLILNVRLNDNQIKIDSLIKSSKELETEIGKFEIELKKLKDEELDVEVKLKKSGNESKGIEEKKEKAMKKSVDLNAKIERSENSIRNVESEKQQLLINSSRWEVRLQDLEEEVKDFAEIKLLEKFDINKLRQRVPEIERRLRALEPVNMKAIDVYDKLNNEFLELKGKADKLDAERLAVLDMINKIDLKRNDVFMQCFNFVSESFKKFYITLANTQGILELTNPSNPLESGLLIQASYSGSKVKSIDSMSGGEKTLTALAFLFAIQSFDPSPFYLFDEADAALDKQNSDKLARMIKQVAISSQFIAITHNDFLFREADQIIGVALNEKKSSVIGLKIKEEQKQQVTN